METPSEARLAALGEDYFHARNAADPFNATIFGISGYDGDVPDPSRHAAQRLRARLAGLADELTAIDPNRSTARPGSATPC